VEDRGPDRPLRGRRERFDLSLESNAASLVNRSDAMPCKAVQELPQRPDNELDDPLPISLCPPPAARPTDPS